MSRSLLALASGLLVSLLACTRGPEPGPLVDAPAAATPGTEPAPAAQAPEAPAHGDPAHGDPSHGDPAHGQPAAAAAAPAAPSAGGLTWSASAPLVARAPKSRMRAAEYAVAGVDGQGEAELTVFYFGQGQGGSVQANLDRWIGQMAQPEGKSSQDAAKLADRQVGGIEVKTLDISGAYAGMGMGGGGGPQSDSRMLAAVATGPEGPVFFKLVGPAATVASAEQAFGDLVGSLR